MVTDTGQNIQRANTLSRDETANGSSIGIFLDAIYGGRVKGIWTADTVPRRQRCKAHRSLSNDMINADICIGSLPPLGYAAQRERHHNTDQQQQAVDDVCSEA